MTGVQSFLPLRVVRTQASRQDGQRPLEVRPGAFVIARGLQQPAQIVEVDGGARVPGAHDFFVDGQREEPDSDSQDLRISGDEGVLGHDVFDVA